MPHPASSAVPWVLRRRLLIRYTDWMPASNGNYFRFINTTLSCTGNITFPLPPGALRRRSGQPGWVAGREREAAGCSGACGSAPLARMRVTLPRPPADFRDARVVRELPISFALIAAGGAGLAAMAAGLWWCARRTGARAAPCRPHARAAAAGWLHSASCWLGLLRSLHAAPGILAFHPRSAARNSQLPE